MPNIVIAPNAGVLEFNTETAGNSSLNETPSNSSQLSFNNGEMNLISNDVSLGHYNSGDLTVTGNRVGIGTQTPTAKLEVYGTGSHGIKIATLGSASTDIPALTFTQGGVDKAIITAISGYLTLKTTAEGSLKTGIFIKGSNVGISAVPGTRLHIDGHGSSPPSIRFVNCAIATEANAGTLGGKNIYGWLPVQIDNNTTPTIKYIPLFN